MIETIVLPTIEHSGSRLTAQNIFAMYKHNDINRPPTSTLSKYYDHLYSHTIDRFDELSQRYFTVVPLRHPLRIAYSWERRGQLMKYWFQQFEALITRIDKNKPFYFPVDLKIRYELFEKLKEMTGQPLDTDWPYVGEYENVLHEVDALDLKCKPDILAFVAEHKEFFGRFYDT